MAGLEYRIIHLVAQDLFANKMNVDLYMLSVDMKNRTHCKVIHSDIVTSYDWRSRRLTLQFTKKRIKPTSAAQLVDALYSDSVLVAACGFLDDQNTRLSLANTQYPPVERRSSVQDAQLTSAYPWAL